jgi:hypothetical protein
MISFTHRKESIKMVLPPDHPNSREVRAQAQAKANWKEAPGPASKKGKAKKVVKLDSLKQLNLNAAGLDIGAAEIWACVPEDRDETSVRVFRTFTADLHALADWLAACEVDTVAMESTGVYWIPVYEILEGRGFEVYLVNAQHIKNVNGRKTDLLDCQSPKGRRSALGATVAHLWLAASVLPAQG